jgi:NADH:ubiquinone oxidoreductase subunit 5 (subunit L)/multisubunit Na+/H+ antiporter MnhA subunit
VNTAAWVCLLLPLAAAFAITLGGNRLSRRGAAYVSTLTTAGAFVAAVIAFIVMLGESAGARVHDTTSWTWLSA